MIPQTLFKMMCLVLLIKTTFCDEEFSDEQVRDDIINLNDVPDDLNIAAIITMPSSINIQTMPVPGPEILTAVKKKHYVKTTGKHQSHISGICSRRLLKGGWGYHPFPGSCNQYIHCDKGGNGYLETCAVGTFFDGRKCVRAEEVDCAFDPCRRKPSGQKYSDGQTCYGYYKCIRGKSLAGVCPSGFTFNAFKQGCLPDKTCMQATGHTHPCFAGTTLPFPGQPHLFYLWDGRDSVTEMECPRGLWYNPQICSCDWVIPGELMKKQSCSPMFHFGYDGNFLEAYNRAPQAPNTGVSVYQRSAMFSKGGQIVIWLMNDIDIGSEWALCFEFMTQAYGGEVALVSNDWKGNHFTYRITHVPSQKLVKAHFRMTDGSMAELIVVGVKAFMPHFLRVAKHGPLLQMRINNMPPAQVLIDAGVMSSPSPMVIGAAKGCDGLIGYFDELKFFRCVPKVFFDDYKDL